ncbi:MAG: enoyl-CoA hydratase-related protein [Roseiarcus sp.]|jgi:3-hydroxyacyl-CoA dehydrogenase/enoyl-CoA hydratase/3-hydroxybutyryl-CoA epimerase
MRSQTPVLEQFRLEFKDNGLVHLVFDAPGRTMNVFSNAAIQELGLFGRWLARSEARGVVVRSGKDTGFCAGADLAEIAVACDMVAQTPPDARFNTVFDHFFRLSLAIRALETSGKPVAAAIAGLALGGGCELALGAHRRVLVDHPRASLGLPESLVGLLPGAGGTQRLPRLIGIEAALPILLEGARLSGQAALKAGLVDELVQPGGEVAAAEAWLLTARTPVQPWDRVDWRAPSPPDVSGALSAVRRDILARTLGHEPAPLAILDCIEFGIVQCFDGAIRSEMAIFSHLIQRAEPRNMIATLFLGKTEFERLKRRNATPGFVEEVVAAARAVVERASDAAEALAAAGFVNAAGSRAAPVRDRAAPGYWIDGAPDDPRRAEALAVLDRIAEAVAPWAAGRTTAELRVADYAVVSQTGYPAYLGGPFAFGASGANRRSTPR